MADFDMAARFPQPFYYCKQFSSYNRLAVTPDDPEGWFSNGDNVGILRTEENYGRQERVLMDHTGPGVITRIWMPHMREDHETPPMDADTVIRFYLDGAKEPAIEAKVHDLITGRNFIKPPFAYISLNAGVVYLPIPFAKGCKITLDRDPFYYIINYRAYESTANVKSFEMQQYDLARPVLGRVGRSLLSPADFADGKEAVMADRIAPGAKKTVTMPAGPSAVRYLEVQIGGDVEPQVLRSTVLRMRFDGDETVWCPLGDFFGSGVGLNAFKGKYRQVGVDGTLRCRWVMPYRRSAEVTIENLGDEAVDIKLKAALGNWDWDGRSMYFHANWRHEYPVPTRPRQDFNYLEAHGKGVYVGDTLTIMNPV
ncbi:MAG: DUF2961 domain-containing protein, partial [Planctomycetes bacterium]|nr:DUF2961 domain-containing protein [Planctomycetota bacterium]